MITATTVKTTAAICDGIRDLEDALEPLADWLSLANRQDGRPEPKDKVDHIYRLSKQADGLMTDLKSLDTNLRDDVVKIAAWAGSVERVADEINKSSEASEPTTHAAITLKRSGLSIYGAAVELKGLAEVLRDSIFNLAPSRANEE